MKKEFKVVREGVQLFGWSPTLNKLIKVIQVKEPAWIEEESTTNKYPIYVEMGGALGGQEIGEIIHENEKQREKIKELEAEKDILEKDLERKSNTNSNLNNELGKRIVSEAEISSKLYEKRDDLRNSYAENRELRESHRKYKRYNNIWIAVLTAILILNIFI